MEKENKFDKYPAGGFFQTEGQIGIINKPIDDDNKLDDGKRYEIIYFEIIGQQPGEAQIEENIHSPAESKGHKLGGEGLVFID